MEMAWYVVLEPEWNAKDVNECGMVQSWVLEFHQDENVFTQGLIQNLRPQANSGGYLYSGI